jgi:hypothetical protein
MLKFNVPKQPIPINKDRLQHEKKYDHALKLLLLCQKCGEPIWSDHECFEWSKLLTNLGNEYNATESKELKGHLQKEIEALKLILSESKLHRTEWMNAEPKESKNRQVHNTKIEVKMTDEFKILLKKIEEQKKTATGETEKTRNNKINRPLDEIKSPRITKEDFEGLF